MKKTASILLSLTLLLGLLTACGGGNDNAPAGEAPAGNTPAAGNIGADADEPADKAQWADGVYYAEGEYAEKSGYKEILALKVEGGIIASVNWNALHRDGGLDKRALSEAGTYGMALKGGAQAEWHEQAAKLEQFLLEQQNTAGIALDAEGKTDAVSGVSIGAGEFVALVEEALAAGPVEAGPYKDGTYLAEAAEFDAKSGWKETVQVTVMNGKIVAASWNGVHKDGGTDKATRSKDGEYGMVANGGAQAEWHEQAAKAEQFLLEKQDPAAIPFNSEDGKTDAISGVSIHVDGFVELAGQALAQAK